MDGHSRNNGHGMPYQEKGEDWGVPVDPNDLPDIPDHKLFKKVAQEAFLKKFTEVK